MIQSDAPLAALAQQYISALLRYDRMAATKLVLDALNGGTPMRDIYEHVFASVQREIGRLWQVNKLTVAEEHYCTAASQLIISQLYPYMFRAPKNGRTMVGMCTTGDLHEMGVRMVCDFFEMEGWDTMYLGANVPLSSALQMLRKRKPQILALSATIPYHVSSVGEVIAALRHDPQFDNIKVLVGGYAFCKPDLWRSVGADAYGRSAAEAVELANSLVS
jgi:methanogenic corrinoid protein MtbC1